MRCRLRLLQRSLQTRKCVLQMRSAKRLVLRYTPRCHDGRPDRLPSVRRACPPIPTEERPWCADLVGETGNGGKASSSAAPQTVLQRSIGSRLSTSHIASPSAACTFDIPRPDGLHYLVSLPPASIRTCGSAPRVAARIERRSTVVAEGNVNPACPLTRRGSSVTTAHTCCNRLSASRLLPRTSRASFVRIEPSSSLLNTIRLQWMRLFIRSACVHRRPRLGMRETTGRRQVSERQRWVIR